MAGTTSRGSGEPGRKGLTKSQWKDASEHPPPSAVAGVQEHHPTLRMTAVLASMPMLGRLSQFIATPPSAFLLAVPATAPAVEGGNVLPPIIILVLSVVAGIGTVLLLPARREASIRKIGGVVVLAAGLILGAMLIRALARAGERADVYFWFFAAVAIIGATRVITHSRPVYSALYFVLTVFASAGLFVLLAAEFMAAALVIIYAGAILITYVFVIMLAASATTPGATESESGMGIVTDYDNVSREPIVAAAVGFALMGVLLFIVFDRAGELHPAGAEPATILVVGSAQELGAYLFQDHIVNLELAGLILTVSMVGAIIIARRNVELAESAPDGRSIESFNAPMTPVDDDPHSIPVYGTANPRQKAYPET